MTSRLAPENVGLSEEEIFDRIWNPENPNYLGISPTIDELAALVPDYPYEDELRRRGGVLAGLRTVDDRYEDSKTDDDGGNREPSGRRDDSPSAAQRMFLLRLVYEAADVIRFDPTTGRPADGTAPAEHRAIALDADASKKTISKSIDLLKALPELRKTYVASRDLNGYEPVAAAEALDRRLAEKMLSEFLAEKTEAPTVETPEEPKTIDGTVAPIDGYYTVVFETGDRRTLRISTAGPNSRLAGRRIVSYLAGSSNTDDYRGFGFIDGSRVSIWKRYSDDSTLAEAVRVLISDPKAAAAAYAVESGNCFVCGRLLTTPESIEAGIGPVCSANTGW